MKSIGWNFGSKREANFWTYVDFNTCIQLIQSMAKGQIISKANYGILNSSKKRTSKFDFTTMIPQVDLFSLVFWRKLKTPKRHFEIN